MITDLGNNVGPCLWWSSNVPSTASGHLRTNHTIKLFCISWKPVTKSQSKKLDHSSGHTTINSKNTVKSKTSQKRSATSTRSYYLQQLIFQQWTPKQYALCTKRFTFYFWREQGRNEAKRTRRVEFLATGEASKAIFWPTLRLKGKIFHSSEISAEGTSTSASMIPHRGYRSAKHVGADDLQVFRQSTRAALDKMQK